MWNIFVFLQNHLLFFLSSFWWNHGQFSSTFIMKKSSHSVSSIKWRTFTMLPRQQFHPELMATVIGKLWQNWNNSSAICISNALDLFPGWSSIMTALFSKVIACDVFDLMLCPTLHLHDWVLKNKHSSISQFPSCSSFYILLQDPQKQEEFHKNYTSLYIQFQL